jgi:hypothetical protein
MKQAQTITDSLNGMKDKNTTSNTRINKTKKKST